MKLNGLSLIGSIVALFHVAALSFAFGPWHWKYLLATVASGALLWVVLPALLPLRRWTGWLICTVVALTVQQTAFWLWRAKLGGMWWPLVQFASVHFLIGLWFGWSRYRRPSTFVWRDAQSMPMKSTSLKSKLKSHDETLA